MCIISANIEDQDGNVLGEIKITEDKSGFWLERTSFVSALKRRINPNQVKRMKKIIAKSAWKRLYNFDPELNPWYCPKCRRMYSGEEWRTIDIFEDDGWWHDSIRGTCPRGHERQLED